MDSQEKEQIIKTSWQLHAQVEQAYAEHSAVKDSPAFVANSD